MYHIVRYAFPVLLLLHFYFSSLLKMRLEIFLFLMWLSLIYAYNAKNVDSKDVIFLKNPSRGKSNTFGHSVALARNYVYVGAPHDSKHGNVFKCRFNANDPNQQNPTCSKVDGKCSYERTIFFSKSNPYIFWILVDSNGLMTNKRNKNLCEGKSQILLII